MSKKSSKSRAPSGKESTASRLCQGVPDPEAHQRGTCGKELPAGTVGDWCAECVETNRDFDEWCAEHAKVCKQDGYDGYGGSCCTDPHALPVGESRTR